MTTAAAAGRLGVSQRQIQRLITAGELPATRTAGDAWVVDTLAVNAMTRARPARGRPWSPATAWAALWRLSRLEADWLDRRTTSRLAARLASVDAEDLLHATRRRAVVHRYRASESYTDAVRDRVVLTGASASTVANFDMDADRARTDGYCARDTLDELVTRFRLASDDHGNVTLRVVDVLEDVLLNLHSMPIAVVASDLAESYEPRERAVGLRVLERLLP